MDRLKCAGQHFGLWCIEPHWLCSAVAAIKAGTFQPMAVSNQDRAGSGYAIDSSGIAHIPIVGQITKGQSSYGGTSSVLARRAIRSAARDSDVKGILLSVDSPGGTVAGTAELARDIAEARRQKPTHAHVEDLGASAAYWAASQAGRISASRTSEVGSIGTMAIVEDSSGAAEKAGVKVHVISTGARKGDRVPGTMVTEEQLSEVQMRVNDMNEHFLADIARGRNVSASVVDTWADGRVHIAQKAKDLGMIDAVESLDVAADMLRSEIKPTRDNKFAISRAEIACLKNSI